MLIQASACSESIDSRFRGDPKVGPLLQRKNSDCKIKSTWLRTTCSNLQFDFDEHVILSASELGKGKHKVVAEVFASWNKHAYIEKNEERMHSEEIEIEIN